MTEHPAHAAGRRSREAVQAKDKQAWLEVFADDAIVEDPIGHRLSTLKARGTGQGSDLGVLGQGDRPADKIEFNFRDTFQCGNEEANVGNIVITMGEHQITAEGVFTYKVDDDGKLVALRAYWEMDRAAATARPV
ncbi:putative ketosteroid isomerase-like protein [Mycobacterium xenopi 3993]|nr:putative ketosteroid isomerase-like protein [Mycobacterium xenopi 3993]